MEKDLKAQNGWPLTAMYVGTLLLVAAVHWGLEEVFRFSLQLGEQVLVVAAITAFGGVLSHFLPNGIKHPLVYWRFRNVLSGHRCRSICEKDPRLLSYDLKGRWPRLFGHEIKENEQNAYWYKVIYRPVRNAPEVLQAHRSFSLIQGCGGRFILAPRRHPVVEGGWGSRSSAVGVQLGGSNRRWDFCVCISGGATER